MSKASHKTIFSTRLSIIIFLSIALLLLIPITSSFGQYNITFIDVLKLILGYPLGGDELIVIWLRLRRILVGIIVGALLGGAGAVAQATFRNPLASPFTLGISQAAALGIAVALIIGYGGAISQWFLVFAKPYVLPIAAFLLAFTQAILVLLLAYRAGLSPYALVLSSLALSFVYQAILALLQYLVLNELQIATVVFWMFGDLGRAGNTELFILFLGSIPITLAYMIMHLDLDLLTLGDEVAYSSGINPKKSRFITTVIAALGSSLATSFVGVLAFLCLVAPHVARALVGGSHRYLLPASMLIGSILLLLSDTVARIVLTPRVLPVGIVLSFLGAPLLIIMLIRGAKQ
ncbi:MAG: iron ABC transporter permease [Ignisphaera sp.]|uniref:Iron ABC transporter permease n=1 Tax=Ignisphaera aggregans TaxID=334771 RepID=A0A7C4NPN3_9CREN